MHLEMIDTGKEWNLKYSISGPNLIRDYEVIIITLHVIMIILLTGAYKTLFSHR